MLNSIKEITDTNSNFNSNDRKSYYSPNMNSIAQDESVENVYVSAEGVSLKALNSDIISPKKLIVDPSGKYLFLSDQTNGCIIVVGNLLKEHFPSQLKVLTITQPLGLAKPHGMTFLQTPFGDPSAEYRIGPDYISPTSYLREYRRDVLFVANKNCVSYVNISSPMIAALLEAEETRSDHQGSEGGDDAYRSLEEDYPPLPLPNCTYDTSAHFNYTKVDIMSLWFQDGGSQLLCMTKSHNCDFFSLQSETSSFFSDSCDDKTVSSATTTTTITNTDFNSVKDTNNNDSSSPKLPPSCASSTQGVVTPSNEVSVRANSTACPSQVLDGHPHGLTCDYSGHFCLVSEPGSIKLGKLANLTWSTSNDLSIVTSISYTNYSDIGSVQLWNAIIQNVTWPNISQLKPVQSDMFDEISPNDKDTSSHDDLGIKISLLSYIEVLAALLVFNVTTVCLFGIYQQKSRNHNEEGHRGIGYAQI